ncbi:MAG: DUF3302 domain-containing protein [Planctomycetota bacterium]
MLLDYIALGILLLGLTIAFYAAIFIHDIPYMIAKKRDHPQKNAIHVACWLSMFTLHAIWPIVFIWAVSNRVRAIPVEIVPVDAVELDALRERVAKLEQRSEEPPSCSN